MKKTIFISRSARMVHRLFVILITGATLANSKRCPAADISPCVCHGDSNITDVVCSNISSGHNLKVILQGAFLRGEIPHLVFQNLTFSTLPHLGAFGLKMNILEILDGHISHLYRNAIESQPLHTLRVDRNRLADIPSEALGKGKDGLEILSMSGNVLEKLGHRSLSDMRAVQKLTLSENEISEVDTVSLPPNVQYLWISRNNLTTFNRSLHHTKYLKYLDASNNRLTSMEGEFDGLRHLQTVVLDHNHISDISENFPKLDSLTELSLVGNGILEVGEALVHLKHLTRLNLSRNAITILNRKVFENMINLYDLNLSENPLTAVQICPSLKPLKSLRIVNLSNSNLLTLPWNCFDSNTNLEFLDLSRNKLPNLGLTYSKKLVFLDIRFNKFEKIPTLVLPTNGSATLILEDNLWRCLKETTSGLKDLDERGYYFPSGYPTCFPEGKNITCIQYNPN